jgi:imidazolonepropionase-like amidohydrolase
MFQKISAFLLSLLLITAAKAQTTFPSNGAPDTKHTVYAFKNAVLHINPEQTIDNGILLIKDGKITQAGAGVVIPKEAVVTDLKGKHIYAGFIDIYSDYGMPEIKKGNSESKKGAYGWNMAIRSDVEAHKLFNQQQQKADEYRKQGFTNAVSFHKDGIVRGSGALIHIANISENESIIKDKAAAYYSFKKGNSNQYYPSSLMGSVALLRQTYYDAQWYSSAQNKEYNINLEEFNELQKLPSIFEGNDKYNDLRAQKVGDEFKIKYIIKGGGNEYQRIVDIKNTQCKYILPLNFPEAYDVEDPYDAELISLTDLKHWELAPTNPGVFEKNFIPFCLTTSDLKDKSQFLKHLRIAVQHGLSEKMALKALTTNPAEFIGMQNNLGSLKPGMFANFIITNESIFSDNASIYETWSNGIKHIIKDINTPNIAGNYQFNVSAQSYSLNLKSDKESYISKLTSTDTVKRKASVQFKNNLLGLSFVKESAFSYRMSLNYLENNKSFEGKVQLADGTWENIVMTFVKEDSLKTKSKENSKQPELGTVIYPFVAYGQTLDDEQGLIQDAWKKFKNRYDAVLIKNATIWTNEQDSILTDHDVYITEGRIVRIAPNIDVPKTAFAKIIDAKGMHLTPGIIDEHSHIALFSVNEGADASSAEVRMEDVINPEDINIYRQLSGGVTTAHLLHGSANPIGGQNAIIKLRWGKSPEDFKFAKAPGFIKFALGENVKHSNGLNPDVQRFPQTRMGVEQLYYDYFTRAKTYKESITTSTKSNDKTKQATSVRRDLDLEAVAEILDSKRFITCHSYVQSEINMLMHVADSMKFKVNTFTHILEGYKVADKMKNHGANASTFADWWAYKMEVMDAIPYNAAMLTKVGVNTAINSDDAEMGRRLNQEAAKSIKYGGLSEVQALKLVTLNPAKMLHLDDKVGSIKVGKEADLVLWTDNPLSIYAKVNTTIIDGQIYYSQEEDLFLRENNEKERQRLIAKLMAEKHKGTKVVKPNPKKRQHFHCDTEDTGLEGL